MLETLTLTVPLGSPSACIVEFVLASLSLLMKQTQTLLAAVRPAAAASLSPHDDGAFLATSRPKMYWVLRQEIRLSVQIFINVNVFCFFFVFCLPTCR